MHIVFRTDASIAIGHGHVMRCLTLAEGLRDRGVVASFICREHEGHLCDLIAERGFNVSRLVGVASALQTGGTPANVAFLGVSWQDDAKQTLAAIEASGARPEWLVVDHYAIDARWEGELRKSVARIMAIDDLADRPHECDLLLDQNLVADMGTRYVGKVPASCSLLLGPTYALLQPFYAELHKRVPPRVGPIRQIFVFFSGAANSENLTEHTAAAFLRLNRPDIEMDIVVGSNSNTMENLRLQVSGHSNIRLHSYLPTLALMIAKADLAIGAGGATSWERICLGLPSLVVTIAENQRAIVKELDRRGLIRSLGHQSLVDESLIMQALEQVLRQDLDIDWSCRCRDEVDGKGCHRVSDILTVTAKTPLRVRHTCLEDEKLLQGWDYAFKAQMNLRSSQTSNKKFGEIRLHSYLRDIAGCRLYIVETAEGTALAHVRFDSHNGKWRIDCTVAPAIRQLGLDRSFATVALLRFRANEIGVLSFYHGKSSLQSLQAQGEHKTEPDALAGQWRISVCSNQGSWINESIPVLVLDWLAQGHQVTLAYDASTLPIGDICFYLSYARIVDSSILARHKNNLVVHASDLPKGRGWSPLTWQIIEGENRIMVTLFEAAEAVDSGPIYKQIALKFAGSELIEDLRASISCATRELCEYFVGKWPAVDGTGVEQQGQTSFYPRRRPIDSKFDIDRPLREQFNLLRTVDFEHYPAWFEYQNKKFYLKIEKFED